MNDSDKGKLLSKLSKSHSAIRELIKEKDLDVVIYNEPRWSIRDILGHIATWNRETAKALNAFTVGDTYLTPDLDETEANFNEVAVVEQRKMAEKKLIMDWCESTSEFVDAIEKIPQEKFASEMEFPWGDETGKLSVLVDTMIEHGDEHIEEISKVYKSA